MKPITIPDPSIGSISPEVVGNFLLMWKPIVCKCCDKIQIFQHRVTGDFFCIPGCSGEAKAQVREEVAIGEHVAQASGSVAAAHIAYGHGGHEVASGDQAAPTRRDVAPQPTMSQASAPKTSAHLPSPVAAATETRESSISATLSGRGQGASDVTRAAPTRAAHPMPRDPYVKRHAPEVMTEENMNPFFREIPSGRMVVGSEEHAGSPNHRILPVRPPTPEERSVRPRPLTPEKRPARARAVTPEARPIPVRAPTPEERSVRPRPLTPEERPARPRPLTPEERPARARAVTPEARPIPAAVAVPSTSFENKDTVDTRKKETELSRATTTTAAVKKPLATVLPALSIPTHYMWDKLRFSANLIDSAAVHASFPWSLNKWQVTAVIDGNFLLDLQDEIDDFIQSHASTPLKRVPILNEILLAKYQGEYYRARVIEVKEASKTLIVRYIDFGDESEVPFGEVFLPTPTIMEHPVYGVIIALQGMRKYKKGRIPSKITEVTTEAMVLHVIDPLVISNDIPYYRAKLLATNGESFADFITATIAELHEGRKCSSDVNNVGVI